ncbi:MAG: cupin domain-containing protein [Rhodobacteraceae bacterium]|nr:cupin domain-containing protein [Paracoccaceae bacterium]
MPKVALPPFVAEADTAHPVLGGGLGPAAFRLLSDAGGLRQFGAHLERLPPGSRSSFRHWHEHEDELVLVLEGEVWLVEDEATRLLPGEVAAWPAGLAVGHYLENRGPRDALYLTVGTRAARDVIHYPDHDLVTERDGAARRYRHADGRPRS